MATITYTSRQQYASPFRSLELRPPRFSGLAFKVMVRVRPYSFAAFLNSRLCVPIFQHALVKLSRNTANRVQLVVDCDLEFGKGQCMTDHPFMNIADRVEHMYCTS